MDRKSELSLPPGALAQIGRRLRPQVSRQHVREVALGKRKSARVERAIARYKEALAQSHAA